LKKGLFRKGLVLGIIFLFVKAGVLPSTIGTTKEKMFITKIGNRGYIQDLINNASNGDTIYIPTGIYYEHIIINKRISLVGEDKNTTIIDGGGNGTVVYISADWVNISGFTIQYGYPYGITLEYSSCNSIIGNTISSSGWDGIYLYGSSDNIITGNSITNNSWNGIYFYDSNCNIISDNNIVSNGGSDWSWSDGIAIQDSCDNILTYNSISDNAREGIELVSSIHNIIIGNTLVRDRILIHGQLEHWTTHFINTSNTVNGKPVIYCKNLSANTILADGGQIILANCTNVLIENQNTSNLLEIDIGFSSGCTIKNSTGSIILESSNGNTITGGIFTNNRNGIELYSSSGNIITDNTVTYNRYIGFFIGNHGIYLDSSPGNIITRNTITNNEGLVIFLSGSNGNTISNNNIINNSRDGISIDFSGGGNTITGNTITQNGRWGIYLSHSSSNSIICNNITNNNHDGIYFDESSSNTITGNNIKWNNCDGIYLYFGSSNNVIIGNTITHNSDNGIHTYSWYSGYMVLKNIIVGNLISNNSGGVYISSLSYYNFIYKNNLIDNEQNAQDEGINLWDNGKSGNYWDDYTGEDNDGDGIGDTPYPIPGGDNEDRYPLINAWGGVNRPPGAPIIIGPSSGKPGTKYNYKFKSIDPDADFIRFHIDWGDDTIDETGFNPSMINVIISHTWSSSGNYIITVYAEDVYGFIGPEATKMATMPKDKSFNNLFLNWLQSHPNVFPLLQILIQQQWFGL